MNPQAKPFKGLNPNAEAFTPPPDVRTFVNTKTGQEIRMDITRVPRIPSELKEIENRKGGKTRRRRRVTKKRRNVRKH